MLHSQFQIVVIRKGGGWGEKNVFKFAYGIVNI